jgi:photosystem II stability/assembly factor-like uncharacterized protein
MGGRVVDFEAVERDFKRVFLATASGGVFKSVNAGITWEPIFDRYRSASIGDIAVFQPNPDIIWVGTGEANNRNSVAWGDGIYKSSDGGKTFNNMGLETTHQIARVITHPTDANVVYACAIGHLWGYSGTRGLFKTTNGGRSWVKLGGGLPDDGRTGCTDLVTDPRDPDVLYTAFYHRIRRPWSFHSGGPNGGIFKSTDGGRSWRRLTAGLPAGETGRIGLAVARGQPDVVMAIVEAAPSRDLAVPGSGIYRSENAGETWRYVNTYNNRPFYYSQIRINPVDDRKVYVLTTRFMVSDDAGVTLSNGSADQEIHGDFHALWIDPADGDRYYIGMDKGAAITFDGGKKFLFYDNLAIAQYFRLGVDMRDPYFIYGGHQDNGSWAGPSFSRDVRGLLNDDSWKLHWGDGQDVQIDPTDWRKVYSSTENGGFRRYDALTYRISSHRPRRSNVTNWALIASAGDTVLRFNWSAPLVMSPHDPGVLYLGGNYLFRTTDAGESWTAISSNLTTADTAKIARGRSGGITPDNTGAETHGTLTSISESLAERGVIWIGTDDGNVQLTRDGGRSWTNVRRNLRGVPEGIWVGRVEASHFHGGTAYVTFEGHRSDIFTPWIFRTSDYGRTWTDIGATLPAGEVVHVVREDRRNPNLLFAGTEFAVWASLDAGRNWTRISNNLPTVGIQDLVIHPRDNDLIAGTHGRSIWILDDITPLQQLTREVRSKASHLFQQRVATLWENRSRGGQRGHLWFGGENPREFQAAGMLPRVPHRNVAVITYWLGSAPASPPVLEISDSSGQATRTVTLPSAPGIQRYEWDLRFEGAREPQARDSAGAPVAEEGELPRPPRRPAPTVGPGTYRLKLTVGETVSEAVLIIRADPITL